MKFLFKIEPAPRHSHYKEFYTCTCVWKEEDVWHEYQSDCKKTFDGMTHELQGYTASTETTNDRNTKTSLTAF